MVSPSVGVLGSDAERGEAQMPGDRLVGRGRASRRCLPPRHSSPLIIPCHHPFALTIARRHPHCVLLLRSMRLSLSLLLTVDRGDGMLTLCFSQSPFLDLLFKYQCIRTQKKQKVFYW